ncbi:hypothetical protein GDO86_017356 [Hymenochirus boettgeri]|uniref:Saposin B-type domain-containing protein n=1 Tax=Hymenochirus boettgeri TaxID=247094 RepID=A0A8T2IQ67_9PIPI|nr:hypothetical protein GDO86_017356 [Hymenochirus boettgeri]
MNPLYREMGRFALFLVLWSFLFSVWADVALPPGVDRRTYCETCLATVQELKKTQSITPGVTGWTKIKAHSRKVCTALTFEKQSFSLDKAAIACNHLLEVYGEKFEEAFLTEQKKDLLEATLCYMLSKACTGVKRNSFKAQNFDDEALETFLQKHGASVRRSKPVGTESILNSISRKEEL